jgi:hypothetical protein
VKPALSYSAHEVYTHDRDRFCLSLFVPASQRESLLAVYALNVELLKIRGTVKEEMIGHIRYAWWQEAVEGLYAGERRQGQPVLEALAPLVALLPKEMLMPLLEQYREHFPELPSDADRILEDISLVMIRTLCPQAEIPWHRANAIIVKHRHTHGNKWRSWLVLKLLLAGI